MTEGKIIFEGHTRSGLAVTLRYPHQDDTYALWEFINTLSQEQTYILIQGVEISLESEQHYVQRMLEHIAAGQLVQILAFSADRLIGNTEIRLGTFTSSHVGSLGIAIAQPYRGQGLGELLMHTVYSEAVACLEGLRVVTLSVFGNNPAAIHLYRKVGFVEYGLLPGGYRHRDQYVDSIYMMKSVHPTHDSAT